MSSEPVAAVLPRKNLYRAMSTAPTLRLDENADERGGMPTMTVDVAVFNEWTEINSMREGHFLERFSPGSLKKTISENGSRMKVMFQHGKDPQIGQKLLGVPSSIREERDTRGIADVPLFDTSYNRDLWPGLEAGAYGSSMQFASMREDFVRNPGASEYNPDGIPERTVKEARVAEFGPVVWPAYLGATSGLRSITDLIHDVDALAYAGAIVFDDERMKQCQVFISRGVNPDDDAEPTLEPFTPADPEEVVPIEDDPQERIEQLLAEVDSLRATITPVDEPVDAVRDESLESAEQNAPPVDSAEPTLEAHPIRGRRDKSKSYLRKEKPSWQL